MAKEFQINPIETRYANTLFRSRTEARWAVFFDALGIKWHYEYEGYNLEKNGYYLPDFFLPKYDSGDVYVEIKGADFTPQETSKCLELCQQLMRPVLLLDGPPEIKVYKYLLPDPLSYNCNETVVLFEADQAEGSNGFFYAPGYENHDGIISEDYYDSVGDTLLDAVIKSRSYRF